MQERPDATYLRPSVRPSVWTLICDLSWLILTDSWVLREPLAAVCRRATLNNKLKKRSQRFPSSNSRCCNWRSLLPLDGNWRAPVAHGCLNHCVPFDKLANLTKKQLLSYADKSNCCHAPPELELFSLRYRSSLPLQLGALSSYSMMKNGRMVIAVLFNLQCGPVSGFHQWAVNIQYQKRRINNDIIEISNRRLPADVLYDVFTWRERIVTELLSAANFYHYFVFVCRYLPAVSPFSSWLTNSLM